MPLPRTQSINPRLGTYFGIFASAFTALVLVLLIFEQLGVEDPVLRGLMLGGPLLLYAAVGLSARSTEPIDFFASGRRVPAVFNGMVLAVSGLGATGLVTFAAQYQVEFFWVGLAFNAAGIAYIGNKLWTATKYHAQCAHT